MSIEELPANADVNQDTPMKKEEMTTQAPVENYKDLLLQAKNEMNAEQYGPASELYGRALELM